MKRWGPRRKFLLVNLVVLLLILIILSTFMRHTIEESYKAQNQRLVSIFINGEAQRTLLPGDFSNADDPKVRDRFDNLLSHLLIDSDVLMVQFWDTSGTVIYASDQSTIGLYRPDHEPFQRALAGEVIGSYHQSEERQIPDLENGRAIETYVPVDLGNGIEGVVEMYQNLDMLEEILNQLLYTLLLAMLFAFVIFFLLLQHAFQQTTGAISLKQVELQKINKELHSHRDKLRRSNKRLEEIDRLKNDLISNVNHELRTPLTAMKAYSEFLLDGDMGKLKKEQTEAMRIIYESTCTLESTINNMLDLSRLEAGMKLIVKPQIVEEIVRPVLSGVKPLIEENKLKLTVHVAGHLPHILCDIDQTRSAFRNLVSNAIKYTPTGGSISVHVQQKEGFVEFCVKDTGVGIKKEAISRLFDKYYQVEEATSKYKGSGLGLSIVKKIVEEQKGEVRVASEVGKGSTFCFTVPIVK